MRFKKMFYISFGIIETKVMMVKKFSAKKRLIEKVKRDIIYSEEKLIEFREWISFYKIKIKINNKFLKSIEKRKYDIHNNG